MDNIKAEILSRLWFRELKEFDDGQEDLNDAWRLKLMREYGECNVKAVDNEPYIHKNIKYYWENKYIARMIEQVKTYVDFIKSTPVSMIIEYGADVLLAHRSSLDDTPLFLPLKVMEYLNITENTITADKYKDILIDKIEAANQRLNTPIFFAKELFIINTDSVYTSKHEYITGNDIINIIHKALSIVQDTCEYTLTCAIDFSFEKYMFNMNIMLENKIL